jgi:hypothetical protein
MFGQTGQCSQPDGAGWSVILLYAAHPTLSDDEVCSTLLECDFSNPSYRQCNLSRVSGYNVGMGFSFDTSSCSGNSW